MPRIESLRTLTADGHWLPAIRRLLELDSVAAGAQWFFQCPGGCAWRLLLGQIDATTSAVVANRFFGIAIVPPGQIGTNPGEAIWRTRRLTANPAGQSVNFSVAVGGRPGPDGVTMDTEDITVPNVWIDGGYGYSGFTENFDAGDQYTKVRLIVEELRLPLTVERAELERHHPDQLSAGGPNHA